MPLQKHTVFVCFTKNHRDSTMAPVTDAETVQDDDGNVPIVRGRGKPLENGERMAILQALLGHTKTRNCNMAPLVLLQSSSRSQGLLSLPSGREEDRVWKMAVVEPWWSCTGRRARWAFMSV
jgi:hypothetical protein